MVVRINLIVNFVYCHASGRYHESLKCHLKSISIDTSIWQGYLRIIYYFRSDYCTLQHRQGGIGFQDFEFF